MPATPGWAMAPSHFRAAKREKGNKDKKERLSKQKLLKGCRQGQNVTVLVILERLEFKNFSCRPTMVTDNTFHCFMAPPLWNPFPRSCTIMILLLLRVNGYRYSVNRKLRKKVKVIFFPNGKVEPNWKIKKWVYLFILKWFQ